MRIFRPVAASVVAASLVLGVCETALASGPPPAPTTSSVSGGIWASGTVIGVATMLGLYDIVRRNTCAGDFLHFGGPGFDRPLTPSDNAVPPTTCATRPAR